MTDHDDLAFSPAHLGYLDMHFGDQRAGGIEHVQIALFGIAAYRLRNAVRAEYDGCAFRNFGQVFHEHRTFGAQVVYDIPVVHHFVAHVNRRAMTLQRALDDFNCTVYSGAKTARIG